VSTPAGPPPEDGLTASYLDSSGRDDVLSGGARRIGVSTSAGEYRVWVKRTGNNPRLRLLLLDGAQFARHLACARRCPAAELRLFPDDGHISVLNSAEVAVDWLRDRPSLSP
jgi:hypothetical protein